jgi:hypothetical protein
VFRRTVKRFRKHELNPRPLGRQSHKMIYKERLGQDCRWSAFLAGAVIGDAVEGFDLRVRRRVIQDAARTHLRRGERHALVIRTESSRAGEHPAFILCLKRRPRGLVPRWQHAMMLAVGATAGRQLRTQVLGHGNRRDPQIADHTQQQDGRDALHQPNVPQDKTVCGGWPLI